MTTSLSDDGTYTSRAHRLTSFHLTPQRSRWSLLVVAALFTVLIGWARQDLDGALVAEHHDEALAGVVDDTEAEIGSLATWSASRAADAAYWASDDVVIEIATELAQTKPERLPGLIAHYRLRDRLDGFLELNQLEGYFLVAPDGTSLSSMRDSNLGTPNLVASDHPEVFERLLGGAVGLTPPQPSDVPLEIDGVDVVDAETMFVGAPIQVDDTTVAVLLLRLVPSIELGPLIRQSETDGRHRVIFSSTGLAITRSSEVEPLGPITVGGHSIADLIQREPTGSMADTQFLDGDRGVTAAWSYEPELGLGVVSVRDLTAAADTLSAKRRTVAGAAVAVWLLSLGLLLAAYEASARRAQTKQIRIREQRYRSLTDPSPDPVLRFSPTGEVLATNPAALEVLGVGRGDVGVTIDALAGRHPVLNELAHRWSDLAPIRSPRTLDRIGIHETDDIELFYRVRLLPVFDVDKPLEVLMVITDITTEVEREQRLESLALIDPLTGLANRAAFFDRLDVAMTRLDGSEPGGIAVLMLDLDHFKTINDSFGHQVGDQVLIEIGRTARRALPEHSTVARLGGDEFILLSENVDSPDAAGEIADRVSRMLHDLEVEVGETRIPVSASVGVTWTDLPVEPEELVLRADRAMMAAKSNRHSDRYESDHGDGVFRSEHALVRDLFGALERGEFCLFYQPVIDGAGRIRGAEAVLRWSHPRHGLLEPERFLAELMQSGLIGPVGRWVIEEAVAQATRWMHAGTPIDVHLNLSPIELSAGAIDTVREAVERSPLDPSLICVEVTEHAFNGTMLSPSSISRLGELGVRVALDDFGTGVSSISHLKQHPLHMIKLDRDFINGLGVSNADRAIVAGIIRIANDLHVEVVAEGVETREQLDWLRTAGCHSFQGWLFGPAIPVEQFDPTARLGPAMADHQVGQRAGPAPQRMLAMPISGTSSA